MSKEGKRIIYCIYEYEPLLDSSNMTYDDYGRLADDIMVFVNQRYSTLNLSLALNLH